MEAPFFEGCGTTAATRGKHGHDYPNSSTCINMGQRLLAQRLLHQRLVLQHSTITRATASALLATAVSLAAIKAIPAITRTAQRHHTSDCISVIGYGYVISGCQGNTYLQLFLHQHLRHSHQRKLRLLRQQHYLEGSIIRRRQVRLPNAHTLDTK